MTNHYDEMRISPGPAQAEELRQRLHTRLASDSRDHHDGRSDVDLDPGRLDPDERVAPPHEIFVSDASALSDRAHRRRLVTAAAAIVLAVGAAGIALSLRNSGNEEPLATDAPTTTAPPTATGPLGREEIRVTPDVIEFGEGLIGYYGTATVAKENGRLYVLGGHYDGDPSVEDLAMFRPETSVLVAFDDAGVELWRTELEWSPREVVVFDGDPWVRREGTLVRVDASDGQVLDPVTVPPFDLTSAFGSLWFGTSDPEDTSDPGAPARLVRLEPDLSTTSIEIPVVLEVCGENCPNRPTAGPDALWVPLGQGGVALIDPDTNQVTVIPADEIGHDVVQVAFDGDVAYVASRDQITSIVDREVHATTSTAEIRYLGRVDGVLGAEVPRGFVLLRADDPMELDVRQLSEGPSGDIDGEAWNGFGRNYSLRRVELLPNSPTNENGQAVAEPYSFLDGEVTFAAASPWFCTASRIGTCGAMSYDHTPTLSTLYFDSHHGLAVVADPRPVGTGCETGPAPADAEALAQAIRSDPDLEATEPIAVRIAGTDALQMDVVVNTETEGCADAVLLTEDSTPENTAGAWAGQRMRLYLLDVPGESARILAIAIFTDGHFETVVDAAAPILDSFEFHTG